MAEEIVNISNASSEKENSSTDVLTQGITSVDFDKFTKTYDNNSKAIRELITTNNSNINKTYSILTEIKQASDLQNTLLKSINLGINSLVDANKNKQQTSTTTKSNSKNDNPKTNKNNTNSLTKGFSLSEIGSLVDTIKKVNPMSAKVFNVSFTTISDGIAKGLSTIDKALTGNHNWESIGKFIASIKELMNSDSISRTSSYSLFGFEIKGKQSKSSLFTIENAKRFSDSLNIICDGISKGLLEIEKVSKTINNKDISSSLLTVTSIMKLLNSYDSISFLDITFFKWKTSMLISTISKVFMDIQNLALPHKNKLQKLTESTKALEGVINILNRVQFKPSQSIALVVFVNGFVSSMDKLGQKSKTFNMGVTTLINGVTKIDNAFSKIDTKHFKTINLLAAGIGLLGISLFAFALLTPAIAIAAAGLLGLGLTLKFLTNTRSLKDIGIFAASIGILGLAIWAFGEVVNLKTIGSTIIALGTLAAAVWLFSGTGSKFLGLTGGIGPAPYKNMLWVALGLTALAGGIWVWQKLGIQTESVMQVVAGAAAVAMMSWGFSKLKPNSILMMVATGLAVAALGLGVYAWQKLGIGMETIMVVAGGMTAIGLASFLYSAIPMTAPISMLLVGGGILAMGIGLSKFPKLSIEEYLTIAGFITTIGLTSYLYANPLAAVGAGVMLLVGGSVLAMSIALQNISRLNLDKEKIYNFTDSMKSLLDMYTAMKLKDVASATIKSTLLLPILLTTTLAAGSLRLLMNMKYDSDKVTLFAQSTDKLMVFYNGLKVKDLALGAVKAGLLMPIILSTTGAAMAIRIVQGLKIDPLKIESSTAGMKLFISKMVDTFSDAIPKMKNSRKGIKNISKMIGSIKTLADVVLQMSKMEYIESEVRDGKIVPIRVRKLTETDFILVGQGIAKMLNSLIDPLVMIGSEQATYKLGGITIQNPFKSGNKVSKGINALSKIGTIFSPLSELIKSFVDGGFFGETKDPGETISRIVGKVINSLSDAVTKIDKMPKLNKKNMENIDLLITGIKTIIDGISQQGSNNTESVDKVFTKLESLFSKISQFDATGIRAFTNEVEKLHKIIKDKKSWDKFEKTSKEYAKQFTLIKNNINGLDVQRGIILQELTKNIKDANDNHNIALLIQEINRLIGIIDSQRISQEQIFNNQQISNTQNQTFIPKQDNADPIKNDSSELEQLKQHIKELEQKIQSGSGNASLKSSVDNIANILQSRTLSVKMVDY